MLLKTKILLSTFTILLLTGTVCATCESDLATVNETKVYRNYLKQNLFAFLANPNSRQVQLTVSEMNESIRLFMNTPGEINSTVICQASQPSALGTYHDVNLSYVTQKFIRNKPKNYVPRCNDSTPYGECSATKPYFCYSGELVEMCAGPDRQLINNSDDCGCPEDGFGSNPCAPATGRCSAECGVPERPDCYYMNTNELYCSENVIYHRYSMFTCIDRHCMDTSPAEYLTQNCTLLGQCCTSGDSMCQDCGTISMRNSTCISVQVAQHMQPGQSYPVRITMNNTGTASWNTMEGYHLGSINGITWGTDQVEISPATSVIPNETYQFDFSIVAPVLPGTYSFQWKMQQDSHWFGLPCDNKMVGVALGAGGS